MPKPVTVWTGHRGMCVPACGGGGMAPCPGCPGAVTAGERAAQGTAPRGGGGTPVFLPGESQGRGSLVGCHLWGHTESDMTEATDTTATTQLSAVTDPLAAEGRDSAPLSPSLWT